MSEPPPMPPTVEALGDGRYRVHGDTGDRIAYAARSGSTTWVWMGGRAYVLRDDADDGHERSHVDELAMAAPMPATVRSVNVSLGQKVSAGDVLVVLEAMKMELSIKASADGTVRAVNCSPGELVQPGIALVELA